jgi:NodT family efflux transporter outer membrane factor (OMF) lipoprotein
MMKMVKHSRAWRIYLACAASAAALSACMVGPNYNGPPSAASIALQTGRFARADAAPAAPGAPPSRWWLALNDPLLTRLITQAFAASPSLQAAEARVRSARAMIMENRTKLLPSGGATAVYARVGVPTGVDGVLGGSSPSTTGAATAGSAIPGHIDLYDAGFDATWELDLFGGVRRGIEGARANAEAQLASLADAQVSLASNVAQAYVNVRDVQHRIALAAENADVEIRNLKLTEQRRAAGTAADTDVEAARTQLSQTKGDAAALKSQLDRYLDQLAVLCGQEPGQLDKELATAAPLPVPPEAVAIGNPAALIRRRPDIREAERRLAADTAAIGENVANFFPSVTLFGTVGFASTKSSNLFASSNFNSLSAPILSWNVLNIPKVAAEVREAKATRDGAVASYRQTVLSALEDAESSLSQFGHQRETVYHLAATRESAARRAALVHAQYVGGTASLISLLNAESQRISAEANLSQSEAMLTNDYVALQKSLGLGWAADGGGFTSK